VRVRVIRLHPDEVVVDGLSGGEDIISGAASAAKDGERTKKGRQDQ
jgi:hypothetical protein